MRRLITAVLVLLFVGLPAEASERSSCPSDIPRSGFTDVYPLSPHAFDIDCIVWRSIVVDDPEFRPDQRLTRLEMASWLDATLRWVQDRYEVPHVTFGDLQGVPGGEGAEALRKVDVTLGVGAELFDPYGSVPRWQMALFLTRLVTAAGHELPPDVDQGFDDIEGETPDARKAINQLAALGITNGTGPETFSPKASVTRAQMASFVARALEAIWVVHPVASTCDTSRLPIRCVGALTEVAPATDLSLRVPLFMFSHIGDLDVAADRMTDPGTRIDLFVDGTAIEATTVLRRSSGAIYRFWQGTIPAGTRGVVSVEAHTWIDGVLIRVRTVTIDFK